MRRVQPTTVKKRASKRQCVERSVALDYTAMQPNSLAIHNHASAHASTLTGSRRIVCKRIQRWLCQRMWVPFGDIPGTLCCAVVKSTPEPSSGSALPASSEQPLSNLTPSCTRLLMTVHVRHRNEIRRPHPHLICAYQRDGSERASKALGRAGPLRMDDAARSVAEARGASWQF